MVIPDTRVSLLHRLHDRHDTGAWMEFCAIYERIIYRIAVKYGLQDADAREVSQEVLLAVSRRIKDFDTDGPGKFRSWLSTVARNATIDLLRKNRRLTSGDSRLQQTLEQLETTAAEPSDLFDMEARREQFRWAAQRVRVSVTESTWQAFWRTAVRGAPIEATASELGLSVGAVYVARCRILSRIKSLIEPFRETSQ